jgi:integrase
VGAKHFQEVPQRAGLPRQHFHDLGHACASTLPAQGVTPRVVLEISGHIQTSTTMDIYTHVFPEVRREAATVMAETLAAPARS